MQISDHCIGEISDYEVIYYQLNSPDTQTVLFVSQPFLNQTQASVQIEGLAPYSVYGVQVRTVGPINDGERLVSSLSQEQRFMTPEGGMAL